MVSRCDAGIPNACLRIFRHSIASNLALPVAAPSPIPIGQRLCELALNIGKFVEKEPYSGGDGVRQTTIPLRLSMKAKCQKIRHFCSHD